MVKAWLVVLPVVMSFPFHAPGQQKDSTTQPDQIVYPVKELGPPTYYLRKLQCG